MPFVYSCHQMSQIVYNKCAADRVAKTFHNQANSHVKFIALAGSLERRHVDVIITEDK